MRKAEYYALKLKRDKEAARRQAIIEKSKTKTWIGAQSVHTHVSEHNETVVKQNPVK